MGASNDTIEQAKQRAKDCFNAGVNRSANPYRNLPTIEHNSALFEAFDSTIKALEKA